MRNSVFWIEVGGALAAGLAGIAGAAALFFVPIGTLIGETSASTFNPASRQVVTIMFAEQYGLNATIRTAGLFVIFSLVLIAAAYGHRVLGIPAMRYVVGLSAVLLIIAAIAGLALYTVPWFYPAAILALVTMAGASRPLPEEPPEREAPTA